MNRKTLRIVLQVLSLLLLILLPAMENYRVMLFYLPPGETGLLTRSPASVSLYIPEFLSGGYMSWLIKILDFTAGMLSMDNYSVQKLLSYFGGTYWSVTIAGITFVDPLAYLQTVPLVQPVPPKFMLAAAIPIILAVVMGRVFCSWLCPVNTIFEFTRLSVKQFISLPAERKLVSGSHVRSFILAAGLILPLAGFSVLPFILPYMILGRFLYVLTLGAILWSALAYIVVLVIIDTFVQRGFWCNYLCPNGLLLAILGRRRVVNIKHNDNLCLKSCTLCSKACTWDADPKNRYSLNCTNCMNCINKCPVGALSYRKTTAVQDNKLTDILINQYLTKRD